MIKKIASLTIYFAIGMSLFTCNQDSRNLYPEKLIGGFELLPSDQTGINFSNNITETKNFHHYYFSQIYLGSGLAIGDINNDGLPDIFFGGNQVADRLYLNKGDFQFQDITKTSRVAKNSGWTWGVTMADVNADGYLDIYVSRNGSSLDFEDRRNQLYINNGDLTFTESAVKYGLADVGFSTQAVFFDMDNDGDLDMYQLNQPPDKKILIANNIPKSKYKYFLDRIYRNDNGKFKDVSLKVGISRKLAYGLSVNASDINNDGWVDLYVANDYAMPDFLYYNNGDGTFTNVINKELKHITQLSMGSDIGDINNDGLLDLITTDMSPEDHYRSKTNMASMSNEVFNALVAAGGHHQYMTNTLQVNTGLGTFSDIGNMAGIASTDWSWASLIVDLDNDGWKDIIVSNGVKKDVDNNDYRNILSKLDPNKTTVDHFFKLSQEAPSQAIPNYAFKNKGNLGFEKVTKQWGFDKPSFSNGMAYGDLDNDGDLDVVINNLDSKAYVYKNNATGNYLKVKLQGPKKNPFAYGAKAIITFKDKTQIVENFVTRGYFSSVEPGMFFGLGKETKIDQVSIIWPDGKTNTYYDVDANKTLKAKYSKSKKPSSDTVKKTKPLFKKIKTSKLGIDFTHKENEYDDFSKEILLPHKLSENGPFTAVADVDNDGLEDIFIGGAANQRGTLYLQTKQSKFKKSNSQPWIQDKLSEDLGCLFFDIDGDNDQDLYIASGGNEFKRGNSKLQDRIYVNDGNGNFTKAKNKLPILAESTQSVVSSDIDNDGDLDLFVGVRMIPEKYGFPASSYFLINNNGNFKRADGNNAEVLKNIGMVSDAVFSDVDNDGDDDLLIVGEWMTIKILINTNGVFEDFTDKYNLQDTRGIWWSITANDIDNDGDDDYILGNLGTNNKFKASKEHPFKLYANDFDGNGSNDIILAKLYKDDYVPLRGRECTSQQMPYVAEKFKDYHSFASSRLTEILPENKIKDAIVHEIASFNSIILINEGDNFTKINLPNEAQISPIKSSIVTDINKDGNKDIIVVGNHFGVEVETTRYDAGFGAILLGDGKNNFKYINPRESGFYSPKDSRDIKIVNQEDGKLVIVTNNNSAISSFKLKK